MIMHSAGSYRFSNAVVAGRLLHDVSIKTGDGFVASISDNARFEVDLTDYTAVPSFIDVHTHGMLGVDTASLNRDSMAKWLTALPRTGTLKIVPTLVSSDRVTTQAFLKSVKEARTTVLTEPYADVLGARMEGPFISHSKKGAHNEALLLEPSIENFINITGELSSEVRIVDIAPEVGKALELIAYLSKRGVIPSIGHSDSDAVTARKAILAGATEATHLFNAMRSIFHREPGIAGEILINDSINAEIINDPNHLSPGIIRLAVRSKGEDKIIGITDSIAATMMPDGAYRLGSLNVTLKGGKCTVTGTDVIAGSVLTMDSAYRNFIDQGYSILQAVKFLSTNPARIMGLSEEGSIEPGKKANITIIDKRNKVAGIIKNGIYYDFRN
ncbi:MAG: N-acetylglucosamine-6-phosphate deacetylase [Thermoplasmata archaeon]